jgi:IclR family transcriptional regulator, KDG regulon repressor
MAHSVKLLKNPGQSEMGAQSISSGLDLLEIFLTHGPEIGPGDLATLLDTTKTTLHRLIATLEVRGYLYRSITNGKYRLGARVFELGSCFQNQLDIRRAALPELASLVEQTEQAAFLCVRDLDFALCVERIEGRHRAHIYALHMGERQPLHCGAAPRALLSGLSDAEILAYADRTGLPSLTPRTISTPEAILKDVKQTRSQGYVVSNEDVSPGIGAIGSPVRDFTRHVVASISVSGIAASYTPERILALGSVVQAAARRVSEEMGFTGR